MVDKFYKYREVDLDLFVNAASKGFASGKGVPSPWAAFLGGVSEGIDQNIENELKTQQAEKIRIDNEMAPYEQQIKIAQAEKAKIETQAMQENPDAFKDSIIKKAETDRAAREQAVAYETKKTKLVELANSGDAQAMGQAYNDPQNREVLIKDKALNEQFLGAYPNWLPESRNTYQEREKAVRTADTDAKIAEDTAVLNAKFQREYLANQELNGIKASLGNLNDGPFLEGAKVTMQPRPSTITPVVDGKPARNEDGTIKADYDWNMPQEQWKKVPILMYNGEERELSSKALEDFNNYRSTRNYQYKLNKDQGGTTTLDDRAKQADTVKAAQEAAARTRESEDAKRFASDSAAFLEGSKVSSQYTTSADKVKARLPTRADTEPQLIERDILPPPAATNEVPNSNEALPGTSPSSATVATPSSGLTPGQVSAFNTVSALNKVGQPELMRNAQSGTMDPKPSWVKQAETRQQLAAAKAANKASQVIQRNNKNAKSSISSGPTGGEASGGGFVGGESIPPVDQARQTVSSSFVPQNVEVKSPYVENLKRNQATIIQVASDPRFSGMSALGKSLIVQESGGNINAISGTNVKGPAQVTEKTAKEIIPGSDRSDPMQSVILGSIYLENMLANPSFKNNPMLALTAYNGGPGVAKKAVDLAGTTDWNVVKNYIPAAVMHSDFNEEWKRVYARTNKKKSFEEFVKSKAKETKEYAERVIVNIPAFLYSREDMEIANALKQQGVLVF